MSGAKRRHGDLLHPAVLLVVVGGLCVIILLLMLYPPEAEQGSLDQVEQGSVDQVVPSGYPDDAVETGRANGTGREFGEAPVSRDELRKIGRRSVVAIFAEPKNQPEPDKGVYEKVGSGVIVHEKHFVVTNFHVVEAKGGKKGKKNPLDSVCVCASKTIGEIELGHNQDDTRCAKAIACDAAQDLALLKIDYKNPDCLGSPLNDSASVKFSDKEVHRLDNVIAVGNPQRLFDSFSGGEISGVDRKLGELAGIIQHTADLDEGSSGGALLDMNGRLIGINTAVTTEPVGASFGFAIPVDKVREFLREALDCSTDPYALWEDDKDEVGIYR